MVISVKHAQMYAGGGVCICAQGKDIGWSIFSDGGVSKGTTQSEEALMATLDIVKPKRMIYVAPLEPEGQIVTARIVASHKGKLTAIKRKDLRDKFLDSPEIIASPLPLLVQIKVQLAELGQLTDGPLADLAIAAAYLVHRGQI